VSRSRPGPPGQAGFARGELGTGDRQRGRRVGQRDGTRTSYTTRIPPFVAEIFAATIVGVVRPPVVLIAPLELTLNDWPRSVSIVLLWPAFRGSTLFEK